MQPSTRSKAATATAAADETLLQTKKKRRSENGKTDITNKKG